MIDNSGTTFLRPLPGGSPILRPSCSEVVSDRHFSAIDQL